MTASTHHYLPGDHILLVSDIHLTDDLDPLRLKLETLISAQSKNVAAIYILGDLFDYWAGSACYNRYTSLFDFFHKQSTHCKIFFMAGNRDFLVPIKLLSQFGIEHIPDPTLVYHNHTKILLTHGDQLCSNDKGYQWLRLLLQNSISKSIIQQLPYSICHKTSQSLRQRSNHCTMRKSTNTMSACKSTILRWLNRYHADAIIYGHVHNLVYEQVQSPSIKSIYAMDSWEHQINYCMINASGIQLIH